MAPRMYPHYDSPETSITSDGATGEIEVYKLLRATLPDDWAVLYNTPIKAFKKSQSDFYVFVPGKGIVNVDAKGFNYRYGTKNLDGGEYFGFGDNSFWLRNGRSGKEVSVDIIGHADNASANLAAYIKETILELRPRQQWGAYGSLIVFACQDIAGRDRLPGGHPCIFRSEIEANKFIVKQKIEAVLDEALGKHPDCEGCFTRERMNAILRHFIAKHPAIPRSLDFQNNDEKLRIPLTPVQNSISVSIRSHRYVHVRGAAGTGKTMIAMAVAAEFAQDPQKKNRVLYVCFNANLADSVSRQLDYDNVEVLNFHRLGKLVGEKKLCVFSNDGKMDRERSDANIHKALQRLTGKSKFDVLLIDEAQDLSADNLKCLIGLTKRERHVAIFSDEGQTIFSLEPRKGFPEGWKFPREEVFGDEDVYTPDPLVTNLRNTDCIFEEFKGYSSEDTRPGRFILGVPVVKTSQSCREIVSDLRKKNYQPSDIAVLTPKLDLLPPGEDIFTDDLEIWRNNCKVLRTTVQSFKGLEANCVIFVGESQCVDELKYVGLSRAKYELYIVE